MCDFKCTGVRGLPDGNQSTTPGDVAGEGGASEVISHVILKSLKEKEIPNNTIIWTLRSFIMTRVLNGSEAQPPLDTKLIVTRDGIG